MSIEVSEGEHFPSRTGEEGKLCMRHQQISGFHMAAMGTGITADIYIYIYIQAVFSREAVWHTEL